MPTSPSYSPAYRTLAFFGFLADVHASSTGTHDQVMKDRSDAMNSAITQFCPTQGWSIVWGPTIWWAPEKPTPGGDHCWLVAKNDSFDPEDGGGARTVYIISIAGTNGGLRGENWIDEDKGIKLVVDAESWLGSWNSGSLQPPTGHTTSPTDTTTPWIALGAATGAFILATTPGNGPNGPNNTLLDYLRGEAAANPNATFIVAGHSLGGALTPVVAIGLSCVIKAKQLAFPLAGPTPGNTKFAEKYATIFKPILTGPNPAQKINVNYYNTQDIVPMAWNGLDGITALYNKDIVGSGMAYAIKKVVANAKTTAAKAGITWGPLNNLLFTGSAIKSGTYVLPKTLLDDAIIPQHVAEYLMIFGLTGLLKSKDQMMIGFAASGLLLGTGDSEWAEALAKGELVE